MSVHDSYQKQELTLKSEVWPKKLNKMVCKLLRGILSLSDLGKYMGAKTLPRGTLSREICQGKPGNKKHSHHPSAWSPSHFLPQPQPQPWRLRAEGWELAPPAMQIFYWVDQKVPSGFWTTLLKNFCCSWMNILANSIHAHTQITGYRCNPGGTQTQTHTHTHTHTHHFSFLDLSLFLSLRSAFTWIFIEVEEGWQKRWFAIIFRNKGQSSKAGYLLPYSSERGRKKNKKTNTVTLGIVLQFIEQCFS